MQPVMAPPSQKLDMQGFVKGRNGLVTSESDGALNARKGNFDDLKEFPTGRHTPGRGHSTGVSAQSSKRSAPIKQEPGTTHGQLGSRRQSDGQGHFYDTDAESIDETSTAASFNGKAPNPADEDQSEHSSSEVGDEPYADVKASQFYASQVEAASGRDLQRLAREVQSGLHGRPNGRGLPYMPGDSYPTTTSGNPSIPDARNTDDNPKTNVQSFQYNVQNRQQRQQHNAASSSNIQGHFQSNQPPASQPRTGNGLFVRPDGTDPNAVHQQANGSFSFGTAPKAQTNVNPPRNQQQTAPLNRPAPNPATSNPYPSSKATAGERSHLTIAGQQQHAVEARGNANVPTKSANSKNCQPLQPSCGEQDRMLKPAPVVEELVRETTAATPQQDTGDSNQHHEPESVLDYDVDELREMDYHVLRNESFDIDPNAQDYSRDFGTKDDSISTRLSKVKVIHRDTQTAFFKSLSINEWEQAGDWFLNQFSAAVGQLKDVRQQRRKAAQDFENEIEGRFKAVGQKRKQIDLAMSEMKESGGKVLAVTPKKSKKK